MAYPASELVSTNTGTTTNKIEVSLPQYLPGDMILIQLAQDGTDSATFTIPSPWITLSSAGGGGARQWIIYTIAGENEIDPPVITSTITDGFNATAVAIRDFDPVTPFDTTFVAASAASNYTSPAFSTTSDDCLILYFMVEDQGTVHRYEAGQLNYLGFTSDGAVGNHVGYKVQRAAGPVQQFNLPSRATVDTIICCGVAIRNKQGGSLAPELVGGPVRLASYGHGYASNVTGLITELGGSPIELDGLQVLDYAFGPSTTTYSGELESFLSAGGSTASMPGWYSACQAIPETDFTKGLLSFKTFFGVTSSDYVSYRGYALFVVDVDGNWNAYRIAKKAQFSKVDLLLFVFDLTTLVPLATSTNPVDLSRINRLAFCYARVGTTSTAGPNRINIGQLFYWPFDAGFKIVGGGKDSPASPYWAGYLAQGGIYRDYVICQGGGQALTRVPLILGGDATNQSYIGAGQGASTEFKRLDFYQRTGKYYGNITIEVTLPADKVDFSYSSTASVPENKLILSNASSPTATYDFESAIISGLDVEWSSGSPCNGASFYKCKTIKMNGALFSGCNFQNSADLISVNTSNPGNIENCSFTQGASGGHAIEITQPGTFAFVGNTFSGYGLDGTTDAAIYNNSGGHVVLNVSGGGDTPTVRNGAGATTDVVSGAQVSVVGLAAGSQVKVTKVSNGDVLFNGAESGGQVSFSTTYIGAIRIDARKASASPYYKPWSSQANTVSGQTVEITALQELDE